MAQTGQERVERIAFEVGRLAAEQERLLGSNVVSGPNSDDVANPINAATEFASHYRPKSLVGAMFQTMLAASDIDNIVSFVPDEKRSHVFNEMVEATERRLRGAIDYLEQRSGTPLAEVGGNYCYSRQSDPFAVTDPAPMSAAGHAVVSAALPLDGAIPAGMPSTSARLGRDQGAAHGLSRSRPDRWEIESVLSDLEGDVRLLDLADENFQNSTDLGPAALQHDATTTLTHAIRRVVQSTKALSQTFFGPDAAYGRNDKGEA